MPRRQQTRHAPSRRSGPGGPGSANIRTLIGALGGLAIRGAGNAASSYARNYVSSKLAGKPKVSMAQGPFAGKFVAKNKKPKTSRGSNQIAKIARQVILNQSTVDQSWSQNFGNQITALPSQLAYGVAGTGLLDAFMQTQISNQYMAQLPTPVAVNTNPVPNGHWYLKDQKLVHTLTNASSLACRVIAYKCVARRDIAQSSLGQTSGYAANSSQTSNNTYMGGAIVALEDGFAYNEALAANASTPATPKGMYDLSSTPYRSGRFCEFFKILSTTTIQLQGGGTSQLVQTTKRRRRVDVDLLNASSGIGMFKGTQFYLFKVIGQAANDVTTSTAVGTAEAVIDIITTNVVHWSYLNLPPKQTTVYYGNAGIANIVPHATNPESGVGQTETMT